MKLFLQLGLIAATCLTAASAHAAPIDLSGLVDANLSDYYNGSVYPADGGGQTIGGVAFDLAAFPGGGTGIVQAADGHADSFIIPIGEAGVTSVYTVANSAFGVAPYTIGSFVFTGSGGASYTYELTEGDNIRDHATTFYNDSAANLYATKDYGAGDHLDVQQIVLPTAFASQTLVSITFDAVDSGNGDPFLAAITTVTGAVPEPATWAMMLMGFGLVGYAMRNRRVPQINVANA